MDGPSAKATALLAGKPAQCLAVDPHDRQTLYAGGRAMGVWRSGDGGATWRDLELPQPDVFSLAVSPADGTLYAGCEPSMLFRSGDGGATCEELSAIREIPSATTGIFLPRTGT